MKELLQLSQLTIGYGSNVLIDGAQLEVNQGEIIGLIGRNGSGKTSLINAISGHLDPLSGEILFAGKSISSMDASTLAKHVSIVNTHRSSEVGLTVESIVKMGRFPYLGWAGRLNSTDEQFVNEAMEMLGVLHLGSRRLTSLSDGEYQRVMIARAIAQDTPLVIMDEPTAFLDIRARSEFKSIISKLATSHQKSIIYSSHDIHDVLATCHRLLVITEDGLIEAKKPFINPEEIAQRYF